MEEAKKGRFSAGPLTFAVRHELWDGNIQDHPDQGVAILVMADAVGKETALLRFNCFDFERSYVYGPENADLRAEGPAMLGGAATTNLYRMDTRPSTATRSAGRSAPWGRSCRNAGARGLFADRRARRHGGGDGGPPGCRSLCPRTYVRRSATPSSHNRGTHIFEAATSDLGSQMRRLAWAMAVSRSMS